MSINMTPRDVEFRTKVGSREILTLTIVDNLGNARDLSNTTTFATGKWKVWKPNGTLLINGNLVFETRADGIVNYTLTSTDTAIANAGIWEGEVEIKDTNGNISEQTGTFNFVIEESY